MIHPFESHCPSVHEDAFVADSADLVGQVEVLAGASVWFQAVLRGDNDLIRVGENSNVQDGSVIHTDAGLAVIIEDHVTVGHKVMLHGCHVGAHSLVGINSVVLNEARIGRWCLIGANTMVTSGKVIPDRSLVLGSPGKVVREITDEECQMLSRGAQEYRNKVDRYRASLRAAAEGNRPG